MTKITSSTFLISTTNHHTCPPPEFPEFVFIGRSNVGKSTLINILCGKKQLAKTSVKPGKTQLINYFSITSEDDDKHNKKRYLVDLPGYGYAKASQKARFQREDMITDYLIHRKNITQICVLIDSSIKPQALDLGFIERLYQNSKSCLIVFTKSDKVRQKDLHTHLKAFATELTQKLHPQTLPGFFVINIEKKNSTDELLEAIHELAE